MPSTPLFAFGHGLSYTTFAYGPLELERETVNVSGELRLSFAVTNTGERRGTEVVQLYAADTATGVTLPAQQLVGFARVDLEPGASKTVAFAVPMSLLAYTGLSGDLVMEPGPVELSAGSSSMDIRSGATVTVTGETRSIRGQDARSSPARPLPSASPVNRRARDGPRRRRSEAPRRQDLTSVAREQRAHVVEAVVEVSQRQLNSLD
jgi:hypothetical protein